MIRNRSLNILCILLSLAGGSFAQNTWYVSPKGNDRNAGTQQKPFMTLNKAIEAVKNKSSKGVADYRIILRGGTYPVYQTIKVDPVLNPESSLSIEAYAEEIPVLSGNKGVGGAWTMLRPGIWKTTVKDHFNQLFVDGKRAVRARFPNADEWLQPDTIQLAANRLVFNKKIPDAFHDVQGAELHSTGYWHWIRQKTDRFDVKNHAVFTKDYPGPECSSTKISVVDRIHFENSLAFLDTEGEWFLDSRSRELYVFSSRNPSMQKIEYAVGQTLLAVEGSERSPLRQIRIKGLTFTGTEWDMPAIGRKGIQAGYWGTAKEQPVYAPDAALMFNWTEHSTVENCRFERLGEGAVALGLGTAHNLISGNTFNDVGSNVIQIGFRKSFTGIGHPLHLDFERSVEVSHNNIIRNNHLKNFATTDKGSVGIWIGYSHHNQVEHNLLEDFPYSGMSIGWRWDTLQTNCHHNVVAWNEVRNGMKYLSDGAGIYFVGNQPGSRIVDNWVHDIGGGYVINSGVYVDEGGANIEIARNYFLNLTNPREAYPIKLHKNIIATMNIHDNGGEKGKHQVRDANPAYLPSKYVPVNLVAPPQPKLYGLE